MSDASAAVDLARQPDAMTEAAWRTLGEQLFGADTHQWRFICPHCGHVMSMAIAKAMPEDQRAKLRLGWSIESECVGRYLSIGCDWAAYGLFSGPVFVLRPDGHRTPVFGFAASVPEVAS